MKYGYARVSTDDQKADLQIAALKKADCEYIFTGTATGASSKQPELTVENPALIQDRKHVELYQRETVDTHRTQRSSGFRRPERHVGHGRYLSTVMVNRARGQRALSVAIAWVLGFQTTI